ncbi:type IX secretion system sortase PorU [Chryseobacterium chendengshani]|uniref:type IX secretion system sortase PorU n=1 Tax=Chryseobacterium sp. LJ668 TaxID=2864040 RepID=UPI001C690A26|nr:type IX secretion system sortase PorU [Chryseobacterium sp. LJ668]MBW8523904.1 type IX secretion system sortase PorU [Chryseobacterium sp. LJ668]QYK16844.1 type IX secretion system sortase PorU [Chryseobacterium sp. LJ668]
MRLKTTLFFIFALISTTWAQRVSIEWDGAKIEDFGDVKKNLPNFKNEGFSFSQNNVFILNKQKIGENQLKVSNLVWEAISNKDLFDLNKDLLPDNDIADINYYYLEGERFANINVGLFKNINGRIQRLSSFEITPSNLPVNFSAQKVGTTVNPLSTGGFYKIKVDKSGIFKITTQFLKDIGINPSNVNPKNFRIYGNGGIMLPEHNQDVKYSALQENSIQVVGEDDGVWNDADYALFYAQGPNGYNLYNISNGNGFKRNETRSDDSENVKNIYEDFSYYYINYDKGAGKRVQNVDLNLPATAPITRYDEYQVINNDQKNLLKVGRIWVEDQSFSTEKTITFTLNSPIQGSDLIRYRTQVVGYKSQQNNVAFTINNQNPVTLDVPPNASGYAYDFFPLRYKGTISSLSGNQIIFKYNPNIATNPNGAFHLDYVEVQYREDLKFNGSQMNFRDFSLQSGSNTTYGFSISSTANMEQVWDVTDITNANRRVNKAGGSGTFNFAYNTANPDFNNEFVAFRADAAFSPQFVERINNQNLSALQNVDYLIITTPEMMSQAQRLANYHQTKNNYNVQIVDATKIYNEFGSGSRDLTAIRDFVTKLNTPLGSLKYVFILGDASYDYKNRVPNNSNIVSSYQSEDSGDFVSSFVTDDYIVMTKPQTTTFITNNLPDLPVGRIPAANPTEAGNMMDKTMAYYNSLSGQSTPFGEWRMKLDFVVDDDNDGGVPFHTVMNNTLQSTFEIPANTTLKEYNVRKLYLDAFQAQSTAGGQRYPQVNQAISNDLGNSLYLFYLGHGGINGWAQERVFTLDEIQNANNFSNVYSRFPFVSTITCEFTLWDEPGTASAGEQLMKLKQGGAAAMITSSRAVGVGYGLDFTNLYTKDIFKLVGDDFLPIGDTHLNAKKTRGADPNHLKVNLLGDPAMKLSRPKRLLVIDGIETPVPGLIRGLDFVKITGHINNANGTTNTTFNGRVVINIFDKRLNKTTLNNDGGLTPVLNYTEEGSAIVKASGTAVNGVFKVEFYVPKDINYAVGEGRLLGYADNKSIDVFNNQSVQVGDINPNGINDNEPPKVKLYMNNTNFANGGITNQSPMLLACVTDDTGINSTGSGIGHDITVYLDGQIINTVVLNDFFASGEGNGCLSPSLADYQKGNVTYPFRNLSLGQHQLTFKVWDINNNSTTETLNFEVKDEADQHLVINRPLNWPNPFTNKTYIHFEHNCDDILDVNVQIYTITGKLVRTLSQPVVAEPFLQGFRTPRQAIEWDGKDDFGDTVAKGTYIFKIFAKSQNQEKCKGSATAVEKMVLLK